MLQLRGYNRSRNFRIHLIVLSVDHDRNDLVRIIASAEHVGDVRNAAVASRIVTSLYDAVEACARNAFGLGIVNSQNDAILSQV